jgi:Transposase DDE domain
VAGQLKEKGINLITRARRNMKPPEDTEPGLALLRRRSLIETVFYQLKNLSQTEHTRHRSPGNFIVSLPGGIVAYCPAPSKPEPGVTCSNSQPSNSLLILN